MSRISTRTKITTSTNGQVVNKGTRHNTSRQENSIRVPLQQISLNRLSRLTSNKTHLSQQREQREHEHENENEQENEEIQRKYSIFQHQEVIIGDKNDPQDVFEFEHIIYRTLRTRENNMKPIEFHQNEISLRDRNLLIDCICRYHYKLGLMTNTFYRFIGILDRYLSICQLPKNKLKLYGCACFLIASKIEDIYPAQSSDLISLSERSFTRRELFSAEIQIINSIGFDTTFATPLFYLTQFMRISGQTKETLLLARYILEICQSHEKFYGVKAALIASVSVMVTRILKGEEAWTQDLYGYTQFTEEELRPYASIIRSMLVQQDREETRFMRRKYGSDLFLNVSRVKIPSSFI